MVYSPEVIYEHQIMTSYQASKLDYVISTWNIKLSNDLSAYRNCTRRRQPLYKAYSDD